MSHFAELSGAARDIIVAIDHASAALADIENIAPDTQSAGMIGHNNPPLQFVLGAEDLLSVRDSLDSLRSEIVKPDINPDVIKNEAEALKHYAFRVINWAALKGDLFTTEFLKEAGKQFASPLGIISLGLVFSGRINTLIELLFKHLS